MARKNIVERYSRATVEQRIDIILENYSMFNRILDGYEKSPSIVIRNERDYNRRQQLGAKYVSLYWKICCTLFFMITGCLYLSEKEI